MFLTHQNQTSPSRATKELETIGNNFLNQSLLEGAGEICASTMAMREPPTASITCNAKGRRLRRVAAACSRTIRLGPTRPISVPQATSACGTLRPTAAHLVILACGCRPLARSRSAELSNECPMLGVKQTSKIRAVTSAFGPFRPCRQVTNVRAIGVTADIRTERSKRRTTQCGLTAKPRLQPGLDGPEQSEAHLVVIARERDHETHLPVA